MTTSHEGRRLSGIDSAFLYLERKEIPLHIAAVCIFDGPISFPEFVAAIDSKLHLIPRYRQIVVDPPFHMGYPSWDDDANFSIKRHILRARLEEPGDDAQLEKLASEILSRVMDRSRPLWDIHVVDGLAGGKGALIVRIHHALADGISGISLMKVMLDATPAGSRASVKPRHPPRRGPCTGSTELTLASTLHACLESIVGAEAILLDLIQGLVDPKTQNAWEKLLSALPELAASSERLPFNKPCSGDRKFCWTGFPLEDVQAIREKLGGTVNDVILTVISRAVARYVKLHGDPVKQRFLRVLCPVNVRHGEQNGNLGNQITFLPVALPLGISAPERLLRAVSSRTETMKNAKAANVIALLGAWLCAAPPPLQALFWNAIPQLPLPVPLFNMICTNVQGSPDALYAVGRKMIACYPHVPTGYELGVNCAVQSYNGTLYWGLTADPHVVPDALRLRDLVLASFGELRRAAGIRKVKSVPITAHQAVA